MRFEDALNATRAAVEEGISAGGGVALVRAATSCKPSGLNHDEETGATTDEDANTEQAASSSDTGDDATDATEDDKDGKDSKDSSKPGRYVFVRVDFDKKHLGGEPIKPIEPEKPAELKEAESESASESKSDGGLTKTDENDASTNDDEETADQAARDDGEESDDEEKDDPLAEVRKEYEEAKKTFDEDLRKYNEFQEKVEEGQKKAKEFNDRFADWYYVIPGDSYEKLRLSRAKLIKVKEKKDTEDGTSEAEPEDASAEVNAATSDVAEVVDAESSNAVEDTGVDLEADGGNSTAEETTTDEDGADDNEAESSPEAGAHDPD